MVDLKETKKNESIKSMTLKSAKWNLFERLAVQGIQFALGLVMARLLTPSDYGVIGMLAIFFAVSQTFIDSGFSSALIRKKNPSDTDFSTVFYFNVLISFIAYGILFYVAPWIADFFKIPILCPVLRVQAITLIINAFMAVQVAMLTIRLDFKSLAKRNIVATISSGIIGIILAYIGWGVWALVTQQILAAIINFVFICCVCRWIPKSHFSTRSFKELGSFGSKLLAAGLLHTVYQNLTTFVIGKFYTAKDLGYYSRGQHFAQVPYNSVNSTLRTITYPIFAKIQDDDNKLISVYRKYIRITSMIMFILSGIIFSLSKPLVLLALSEKWENSIIYLQIFALAFMFDHLNSINLNLLKVKGRSDLFLKLEVIKKAISITILFCAVPYGVMAICLAQLLYNNIAIVINTYYTGKFFHIGYWIQIKDVLPYFACCIVACTPAFVISHLNLPNIVQITAGSLIALSIYWMMLRKKEDMIEFINLIQTKIKKNR